MYVGARASGYSRRRNVTEYHKVDSVFKRDPSTKHKAMILGDWARDEFSYLADNTWDFTEKVDGTNIRIMVDPTKVDAIRFGGKTDAAQIPATLVEKLMERFYPQAQRLVEIFPDGGCLYGEGYGARIQKGGGNYRRSGLRAVRRQGWRLVA